MKPFLKNALISLGIIIALALSMFAYVQYNLARYSVYYAHHMPHKEGTNPDMVMTVNNLIWITLPNDNNYKIDDDVSYILIYKGKSSIGRDSQAQKPYYYHKRISDIYYIDYDLNYRGEFMSYSSNNDDNISEGNINDSEKVTAQKFLDDFMTPIIKAQKAPKLNLQWLFNWKYEKRFNE